MAHSRTGNDLHPEEVWPRLRVLSSFVNLQLLVVDGTWPNVLTDSAFEEMGPLPNLEELVRQRRGELKKGKETKEVQASAHSSLLLLDTIYLASLQASGIANSSKSDFFTRDKVWKFHSCSLHVVSMQRGIFWPAPLSSYSTEAKVELIWLNDSVLAHDDAGCFLLTYAAP